MLLALLDLWRLAGWRLGLRPQPVRLFDTRPASLLSFDARLTSTPCDEPDKTGNRLVWKSPFLHQQNKAELIEFLSSLLASLTVNIEYGGYVRIVASRRETCTAKLCAVASADTEDSVQKLLQTTVLSRNAQNLRLKKAAHSQQSQCTADLILAVPDKQPVAVKGKYSAIQVIGTAGPIHLFTTHARISVHQTIGKVDAKVFEGIIDFASDQGSVRLNATWGDQSQTDRAHLQRNTRGNSRRAGASADSARVRNSV